MESRGIRTDGTRIERYIQYLEMVGSQESRNESSVFKNSTEGPFESGIDWLLYVLREIHELMWIVRGLKTRIPTGLDGKLEMIVSGSDFAALDTNTQSRNIQFELRIASYFCQADCEVDLTTETDVIALTGEHAFYVECKRVGSATKLQQRLADAVKQLHKRMPRRCEHRLAYGCVAIDATKAAFPHNGLTFGETNDHSRDIIQSTLVDLADTGLRSLSPRASRNILQYWFQIHIPSLILHPPTTVTRFSNYIIPNRATDGAGERALKSLHAITTEASKPDGREIPPRTLTPRREIIIPRGTVFTLDNDLLHEFLKDGRVTGRRQEVVVGELAIDGVKHEFTFHDLEMLVLSIPSAERERMAQNPDLTRLELLLEMYNRRYPYIDG